VLYGHRDGSDPERQDELAAEHLRLALTAAGRAGALVVVEALSGDERYPLGPLPTCSGSWTASDRAPASCATVYHLTVNGEDPVQVVRQHADRLGHVQVADAPGRHQPARARSTCAAASRRSRTVGYSGWVGLEYAPLGPSIASFDWLPVAQRSAG
jgi:hydroxypyruvate isomerase